jgi:3-oxoadipate enol-lactonase
MIPHHIVTGDGPPLVLSNSLGTTLYLWEDHINALAEDFTVIRYDHRGHGQSETPPGPYTLDDLGQDVVELLDHLQIARAHVAGVSLGGMTAMWLGIHAPERVDKLALLATSARMGPPEMWRERAQLVREQGTQAIVDATLQRWLSPAYDDQHAINWLRETFVGIDDEGYANCCHAIETMDLIPYLDGISAPTLVIGGAHDPATPPEEHAKRIAEGIPGARLEILDGAHLINVECADGVVRLLREFL